MTIKDLARLSGYSVGTVSRALNGLPNVSEQARSAILALAQERGYQLNTNAKYLKQIWQLLKKCFLAVDAASPFNCTVKHFILPFMPANAFPPNRVL